MEPFSIPELKNLETFDMNGCGLEEFPDGIQHYISPRKLDLFWNITLDVEGLSIPELENLKRLMMDGCGLKKLPDGIQHCVSLEHLVLSWNTSLGKEPFSIPKLENLKTLNMTACGLQKLPDGIQHCISLEELELSWNTSLGMEPFSIPELKNLKTLYMNGCGLKKLPDGIEKLVALKRLDMRGNMLRELPENFTVLIERNVDFDFSHNVLCQPPQVICDDPNAILKYFKDIARFGKAHSKRLRVLVIGNQGAGKTSLVNSLLMGQSMLTAAGERTEGIEIRKWFPDPANEDLELEMWDFGGHLEYQSVSHYFIEKHCLCLLVVDISAYEMTNESYDEHVGKWIDELKSIVLRPVVMVTATKCDLVSETSTREKCDDILRRIGEQENAERESITRDLTVLEKQGHVQGGRIEKLKVLARERPVLPKVVVGLSDQERKSTEGETVMVTAPAHHEDVSDEDVSDEDVSDEDVSDEDVSDEYVSDEDVSDEYVSDEDVSDEDVSDEDVSDEAVSDEDVLDKDIFFPMLLPAHFDHKSIAQELGRVGGDSVLFPHLSQTLPLLWVKIEESLPALRQDIKKRNIPSYLTYEKVESWLCGHSQDFREAVGRRETLQAVLGYLVTLGKVLRFEHVPQLKDFVFPDPEWLIMLIKKIVHHNLASRLLYEEDFKAVDMDELKFQCEKEQLISCGLLSRSLLRCIWYDAVHEEDDFNRLVPLLQHFDVGYPMTVKEAKDQDKEIRERYTFIPALMPESRPDVVEDEWSSNALEDQMEVKSVYKFHSIIPVGLFERQMARSHRSSHYKRHWKGGFFGLTYVTPARHEVKFLVTKRDREIEVSGRISNTATINMLWKVVIRLHQIFKSMVDELWPELRYRIWNRCYQCREFHFEMNFEKLCEDPTCYIEPVWCDKLSGRPILVRNEKVFPPQEVVEELMKELTGSSFETFSGGRFTISELNASDYHELLTELNKPIPGKDYKELAGCMGYAIKEIKTFELESCPADALLTDWGTRRGNDVEKLVGILKKMSRDDLADKLVKQVFYDRRCERGVKEPGLKHGVSVISKKRAHERLGERSHEQSDEQLQVDSKRRRQDVRSSQTESVKHLDEISAEYSGEELVETVKKVGQKHSDESSDEDHDQEKYRRPKKMSRKCNECSKERKEGFDERDSAGPSKETSPAAHTERKLFFVRDLDNDVRSRVCQLLNEELIPRRDFRGLAAKMEFEKEEIEEIGKFDNPTEILLKVWGTQKDSTVGNMIKLLREMKRDDVAEILENRDLTMCLFTSKETSQAAHTERKLFLVRDLDDDVRSRVCQLLNEESVVKRDYRGLAAKMEFEKEEIEEIGKCANPTEILLKEWGNEKDSTVGNLIELLWKIKRNDVVQMLRSSYPHLF